MNRKMVEVASFKSGDEVPEWLVYSEPKSTKSVKPKAEFSLNATLYERENVYWLLPDDVHECKSGGIISVSNGVDCNWCTASKELCIPFKFQTLMMGAEND